jgi:tRNA modification GTPase
VSERAPSDRAARPEGETAAAGANGVSGAGAGLHAVETIFAPATAPGRAGVAIVRVSGPAAGPIAMKLAGRLPPARRASLVTLREPASGEVLDRAILLWLPGPASFTGEDTVELSLHGGRAVVAGVLDALGRQPGLRLAEAGEFTRRAFDNGRIDLTRAEGLADLVDAETAAQRRRALAESDGASARLYDSWRERLLEARALVEAALDFADEPDVATASVQKGLAAADDLASALRRHLADGRRGEIVQTGFRVVLSGAPNAGKSSVLNALARRDIAIVSDEPGTTRDVLEARLEIAGHLVVVADTAGLREAAGAIEREGMRRAKGAAAAAHLVLWLVAPEASAADRWPPADLTAGPPEGERATVLRVASKADLLTGGLAELPASPDGFAARVSAMSGDGTEQLVAVIAREIAARTGDGDDAVVANVRHRLELEAALGHLQRASDLAGRGVSAGGGPHPGTLEIEGVEALVAEDLRLAAGALGRITGRVDVEDVLGRIFSRFCIGK